MKRRELLQLGLLGMATLWSEMSAAHLVENVIKHPVPGYYPLVLNRFYEWYCRTFFDFEKHFPPADSNYVRTVLQNTQDPLLRLSDGTIYHKVLWSLHATLNNANYSRLALGFAPEDQKLQNLAAKVISGRGIKDFAGMKMAELSGLGFDVQSNVFKIYFLVDPEKAFQFLPNLNEQLGKKEIGAKAVCSLKFKSNKLVEKRAAIALRQPPNEVEKFSARGKVERTHLLASSIRAPIYYNEFLFFEVGRGSVSEKIIGYTKKIHEEFLSNCDGMILTDADQATVYSP